MTVLPTDRILVLDGAMFTLRAERRLTPAAVHNAYLDAGADIISTDTFGAATSAACEAGARRARAAADTWSRLTPGRPRYVAGVMSPTAPPDALRALLRAQRQGLVDGGVDLLLAETLSSIAELLAVLEIVAHGSVSPPAMISVAVTHAGLLPSGESIEEVCSRLVGAPVFSAGLNCGEGVGWAAGPEGPAPRAAGPEGPALRASLETLARLAPCRVSCHPSAGLPDAFGHFEDTPAETAAFLGSAAAAGLVDIVGGCCGTTPEYIAAIAAAVATLPARMGGF